MALPARTRQPCALCSWARDFPSWSRSGGVSHYSIEFSALRRVLALSGPKGDSWEGWGR